MKKYKYLLLTFLIPLLIPITAYAECTKEDIEHFKEIEDEYTITYEFDKETKKYSITFFNPNPEAYGYTLGYAVSENEYKKKDFTTIKEEEFIEENINPGEYDIEVISTNKECQKQFKKTTLKLSKYNIYSEDPICEGIEEFILCQTTYDKDIDYDTFVSRVNTYKKGHKKEQTEPASIKTKEDNKIIKYIKDNIVQIIVITFFVIMVIITIYLTIKSARKSRRLE